MGTKPVWKERFEYIKTPEGFYVGHSVNLPGCACQAKTEEEFKRKARVLAKAYCKFMLEGLEQDDAIEMKEVSREEFFSVK